MVYVSVGCFFNFAHDSCFSVSSGVDVEFLFSVHLYFLPRAARGERANVCVVVRLIVPPKGTAQCFASI